MPPRLTYLGFHLLFVVPPVVALAAARWLSLAAMRRISLVPAWRIALVVAWRRALGRDGRDSDGRIDHGRSPVAPVGRRRLAGIAVVAAVALAYTTPWDNYLVSRGVWRYGEGLVAARVWHAPVEEYLFVALQTLLVGLWLYRVVDPLGGRGTGGLTEEGSGPDRVAPDGAGRDGTGVDAVRTAGTDRRSATVDAGTAASSDTPPSSDAPPSDTPPPSDAPSPTAPPTARQRAAGVAAGLAVTVAGLALLAAAVATPAPVATPAVVPPAVAALLSSSSTYYLGAIVAWVGPPLALQWGVGWPHLWARRRTVAAGVAVPAVYLAAVDRVAIGLGIWRLSPEFTTGLAVAGLPVEEAVFFLATTLLVVQGLVLYDWVTERWTV